MRRVRGISIPRSENTNAAHPIPSRLDMETKSLVLALDETSRSKATVTRNVRGEVIIIGATSHDVYFL